MVFSHLCNEGKGGAPLPSLLGVREANEGHRLMCDHLEYQKRYREENREAIRAYQREYYLRSREGKKRD